jgi:two-component system, cell cycle response regulator
MAHSLTDARVSMARILIIEDNPANLELMSYLLTAFGHTTLAATDGEQGLALARSEAPDLVVCDIQLPKLDGYEVVRQLKSNPELRAIPIVAVTAFAMVGDRDRVMQAGFDGYIAKPIVPETFVSQVETFLGPQRRAAVQLPTIAPTPPIPAVDNRAGVILAVDNNAANLDLLRSIFEPFGYTVHVAGNIAQALALAYQEQPDIIISDLHMPDGDGFELLQNVKADPQLHALPFVFLSATTRQGQEYHKALDLGADKFIRRPIEPRRLLAEIEACLRQDSAQ